MGFGGNGGGASSIAVAGDAALNNPASNEVLTYDSTTSKWKNAAIPNGEGTTLMTYYNATTHVWPARPSVSHPIMWISTTDAAALRPIDMVVGDMWVRHPDALETP